MSDFEFFMGALGLLLGLSIADLLSRMADAIHRHEKVAVGYLSPLLSAALILRIINTWTTLWMVRDYVVVTWYLLLISSVLASAYYLIAALVFPRDDRELSSLDEHYWRYKKAIALGLVVVSLLTGAYTDYILNSYGPFQPVTLATLLIDVIPFAVLAVSRSRSLDIVTLLLVIGLTVVR